MFEYVVKNYDTNKVLHTFSVKEHASKYKDYMCSSGVRAYIVIQAAM